MSDKLTLYASENAAQIVAIEDTFSLERYQQFARHIPGGVKNVLDVGCAEGRGGAELKRILPKINLLGLDCVDDRLSMLPAAYTRGILGLTTQIPMDDRSCDAIVVGEFLEHLYPSDVDATLCEFQRILAIGGTLLMTTPNPYSLNMRKRRGTVYPKEENGKIAKTLQVMQLQRHGYPRTTDSCSPRG